MFESNEFDRWLGRSHQPAIAASGSDEEPRTPVLDFDEVAEVVVKETFIGDDSGARRTPMAAGAASLERIARGDQRRRGGWILAALAVLGIAFGLGVLVGRHVFPVPRAPTSGSHGAPVADSPKPTGSNIEPAPVANEPAAASTDEAPRPPPPPPSLTIAGTVRYRAGGGEHADEGATILVIPVGKTPASEKLPLEGLRPEDRGRQSRAGVDRLRTIGGSFEYADPQGRFQIEVAQAGKYWVLILSRHKTREKETGLLAGDRPILDQLFADAARLVEGVEYLLVSRQIGPEAAQPINHSF